MGCFRTLNRDSRSSQELQPFLGGSLRQMEDRLHEYLRHKAFIINDKQIKVG
jgi:hypothetical protein